MCYVFHNVEHIYVYNKSTFCWAIVDPVMGQQLHLLELNSNVYEQGERVHIKLVKRLFDWRQFHSDHSQHSHGNLFTVLV